jgi:hypothetical protein
MKTTAKIMIEWGHTTTVDEVSAKLISELPPKDKVSIADLGLEEFSLLHIPLGSYILVHPVNEYAQMDKRSLIV